MKAGYPCVVFVHICTPEIISARVVMLLPAKTMFHLHTSSPGLAQCLASVGSSQGQEQSERQDQTGLCCSLNHWPTSGSKLAGKIHPLSWPGLFTRDHDSPRMENLQMTWMMATVTMLPITTSVALTMCQTLFKHFTRIQPFISQCHSTR